MGGEQLASSTLTGLDVTVTVRGGEGDPAASQGVADAGEPLGDRRIARRRADMPDVLVAKLK